MEDLVYGFIHDHLYMHVILIVLAFAGTLTAMGIDLVFGVGYNVFGIDGFNL